MQTHCKYFHEFGLISSFNKVTLIFSDEVLLTPRGETVNYSSTSKVYDKNTQLI